MDRYKSQRFFNKDEEKVCVCALMDVCSAVSGQHWMKRYITNS